MCQRPEGWSRELAAAASRMRSPDFGCIAGRNHSFAVVAGHMGWAVRPGCTHIVVGSDRRGSGRTVTGRSLGCHRSIISLHDKKVLRFKVQTYRRSLGYFTLPFWVRVCSYLVVY